MFVAKVTGSVVATQKVASMTGQKLLVVEPDRVDESDPTRLKPTGRTFVAVDTVGAGTGEFVLIVQGSSARLTPETKQLPVDAAITLTLSASGGRTVTALRLQNGVGGVWDTTAPNSAWLLGVATSFDGPLLNAPTTMAVNVAVPDGGSLVLFASDYGGGAGFASGRTLTVTATFSDGTSLVATVVTP